MKQREAILQCLKNGWKSPLDALNEAGTMKLSTRVGELRRSGYVILDKWSADRRYKLYKLVSKGNA
jgi:hypothetical protein